MVAILSRGDELTHQLYANSPQDDGAYLIYLSLTECKNVPPALRAFPLEMKDLLQVIPVFFL